MNKKLIAIAAITVVMSGCTGEAADYSGMSPQALQSAAIEAVNNEDSGELMAIMQEMKSRNMLFFRKAKAEEGPECKRVPEKVGFAKEGGKYLIAKSAYEEFMLEYAMEHGICGCLTGAMTYREFLKTKFGYTPETLTEDQWKKMRTWVNHGAADRTNRYYQYYSKNCRGE